MGGDIDVGTTIRDRDMKTAPEPRKRRTAAKKDEAQVSQVLKSVYQRTVDEDIPTEMLDLLSKLD
ncbi:NepR family anti-sigma factor [Sphingobium yanoikuyae]|jgi:Anti-sigma factor NepR|uniref:NepR family anti-sigma factor n=1 Tax=Sphingobium yanoikuyae TaxID=13690 RepID=A0AA43B8T9_SPHYA|nr:NepR family anti-sigma factor [Sphingobium yanoikuyae]MDH2130378.1 NepR family anti-sigma factor [Sphingobium yanoikuyae]MDH2148280.1 NepR family anti-sigma factor [Sphingobium yanoikuyae]MDH2165879.1 NepR family anti-sigma factor [Sphingobium yanoikuyae]